MYDERSVVATLSKPIVHVIVKILFAYLMLLEIINQHIQK